MSDSRTALRSTFLLTGGRIVSYGLSFVRNMVLARVLTREDFGLVAVISMAMMLLEISGRMAFGTQIIQAKEGDSQEFQATAHTLQFIGGLGSALLMSCLCVPLAHLFGVPHATWAFALLALVPLVQCAGHLDVSRRQRHLDFAPLVLVDVIPQLLITAAAWPLARWIGDYRTIVYLMIGKAAIGTVLSYCFAQRPYRWSWNHGHIRRMLSFGWPLLLNGLVMFGSQQADQLLVGAAFSLHMLANYTLAFSLVSIPWLIFGQALSSLMLPLMARTQHDQAQLRRQYRQCSQVAAAGGVLCLLPLIVAGEQIVVLFYGPKYHGAGDIIALLGAAGILRFLRFAPAVAALAKGDTINQLYSNLWRCISLPLALFVWSLDGSSIQIAGCALAGEAAAVAVSLILLQRRQAMPLKHSLPATGFVLIAITTGAIVVLCGAASLNVWLASLLAVAMLGASLGLAWLLFPEVMSFAIQSVKKNWPTQSPYNS